MKTIRDICKYIGSVVDDGAVCVETGCSYVCHPGNEEHTTTNNIYEYINKPHGIFYSLDIDPEHIDFACEFVRPLLDGHADMHFVEGDSVTSLETLSKQWSGKGNGNSIDVLCLDSKDFDEDHMVNEFNAIRGSLHPDKHFVLVDDIHNPNSVKYKKMVPILKNLGYTWIEVPTPTGMFVAAKGYKLP
jgi:hypothetical protein